VYVTVPARDFVQPNHHRSFAPLRTTIPACWFVDGAGYMSAVADAIENAKEEIFITDWWLSPEIHMKRPAICGEHWRLDKLLQRKAESGVKIFVLLYKELEVALGLNSYYSKQKLAQLSDNIKVLRHPDHARVGVFLWAHHEKIVVVDQSYAFVGGIDLCYGRWDDAKHRLTDLGSITPTIDPSTLKKKTSSVPGGDAFYPIPIPLYKQTPIPAVEEPDTCPAELPSSPLPQLEPGDSLLMPPLNEKMKCNTPNMERKNVIDTIKNTVKSKGKDLINLVYTPHEDSVEEKESIPEKEILESLNGSSKLWVGKDYVNFIVKDFNNLDSPFDDFIDRVTTPRMPWHDVGVCVQGAAARDVSRHFIQRWNATKLEKAKSNKTYPFLLPKSYEEFKTLPVVFPNEVNNVSCQVLRSVSTWSCGFLEPDTVEQSIHEAYIDTINKAQHYIYIENQFFISLPYNNPNTKNQIAEALYKRIIRAFRFAPRSLLRPTVNCDFFSRAKEVFRVFVVMPLLPGFEGEVGGPTGTSLHAITHWNYASISQYVSVSPPPDHSRLVSGGKTRSSGDCKSTASKTPPITSPSTD
jgi:phospholipase D1/2